MKQKHELSVVIFYKNYRNYHGISHVGLGVSALNNCKVLNAIGIKTRVVPIETPEDLGKFLEQQTQLPTHVIIQAPWIPAGILGQYAAKFHDVQFAAVCHSNVGFLQVEPNAIKLMKEYLSLEAETPNFHTAGNSEIFCQWIENSYEMPCTYLPNMYYLHHKHSGRKRVWNNIGGVLKIGIFGATRIQKNIVSGVAAGIEIASETGAPTEIWINGNRDDGGKKISDTVRDAAKALCAGLPNVKLIEYPWASWDAFKRVIGSMNLLMQLSYSESFNMVTADGASEGVASVVSDAITWAPKEWQAQVDDVNNIARVGVALLNDPEAATKGFDALRKHNKQSELEWVEYLAHNKFGRVL